MRWPGAWKDAAALSLVKNTPVNCLLIERGSEFEPVRSAAAAAGLKICEPESPPEGVSIIKGEWPGVKAAQAGGGEGAGPTGVPWVDSNGFRIRVAAALNPKPVYWVDAPAPEKARTNAGSYLVAVADSAAYGGRWIISLEPRLSAAIAAKQEEAVGVWKRTMATAAFFAAHRAWSELAPEGVVAVVSNFAGDNEVFSHEMLNLLGRAGLQYKVAVKDRVTDASLRGLRAVVYSDGEAPSPALRQRILAFVEAGGLLITSAKWGEIPGTPARAPEHPRYSTRTLGKGRIAVSNAAMEDPYQAANDTAVLISHRYDLVRFWNGGATGSYYTVSADRRQALVHLLFYAFRGPDTATVRIAGAYRKARIMTVDRPEPFEVPTELQKEAIELHLPEVSQYVAVQLS
jgi:hypothetical protein